MASSCALNVRIILIPNVQPNFSQCPGRGRHVCTRLGFLQAPGYIRYLGDDLSICSQMFNEFNSALVGLTRAITELSG